MVWEKKFLITLEEAVVSTLFILRLNPLLIYQDSAAAAAGDNIDELVLDQFVDGLFGLNPVAALNLQFKKRPGYGIRFGIEITRLFGQLQGAFLQARTKYECA